MNPSTSKPAATEREYGREHRSEPVIPRGASAKRVACVSVGQHAFYGT